MKPEPAADAGSFSSAAASGSSSTGNAKLAKAEPGGPSSVKPELGAVSQSPALVGSSASQQSGVHMKTEGGKKAGGGTTTKVEGAPQHSQHSAMEVEGPAFGFGDDDFWGEDAEKCPQCGTNFIQRPNMKLKYSVCCGLPLCSNCLDERYNARGKVKCPKCAKELSKKAWSDKTLDQQRFGISVSARRQLNAIFNQERRDFASLQEFNDYLEMAEDVAYRLVYGSEADKKEASQRAEQFKRTHGDKIKAAFQRRLAEDKDRAKASGPADADAGGSQAQQQQQQAQRVLMLLEPQPLPVHDDMADEVGNKVVVIRVRRLLVVVCDVAPSCAKGNCVFMCVCLCAYLCCSCVAESWED